MSQVAILSHLLKELITREVRQVIISPGSRSAPLTIAFRNEKQFQVQVVVDERSAAFIALGMAQQMNHPVVLVCTSGTASLNYGPALAEAYYQGIPLIAITADRPPEWIDRGEGQCIRQADVFSNYVKRSFNVDISSDSLECLQMNVHGISQLLSSCYSPFSGPVHLNFPLREPLYGWQVSDIVFNSSILPNHDRQDMDPQFLDQLRNTISASEKVLVLAGQLHPDYELQNSLSRFSSLPNVVVMTEHHSNLSGMEYCDGIDRLVMRLENDFLDSIAPEIVITLGRNIISRKVKAWLRRTSIKHWHLEDSNDVIDVFGHFELSISCRPALFFQPYVENVLEANQWKSIFRKINRDNETLAGEFYHSCPWSDLYAIHKIHRALPSGSALQMGNSSVVRYFLLNKMRGDVTYFSNRGVAGIDGCVSTAVGASSAQVQLTTAVVGDVSFFYDSNALWNSIDTSRLRLIVINNTGGGIFRIIDGSKDLPEAMMSEDFETFHQRSAKGLAVMYGTPFFRAGNEFELHEGLRWLYSQGQCSILEVSTDRHMNPKVLNEFFEYCKIK